MTVMDIIHMHECPDCGARAGERCTTPTDTGRREVGWIHDARRDLAAGWT